MPFRFIKDISTNINSGKPWTVQSQNDIVIFFQPMVIKSPMAHWGGWDLLWSHRRNGQLCMYTSTWAPSQYQDRLIFNMGIAIPGKTVSLIETAPRSLPKVIESCTESCMGIKAVIQTADDLWQMICHWHSEHHGDTCYHTNSRWIKNAWSECMEDYYNHELSILLVDRMCK